MSRALEGVRVLEVAQWWFVPAAGAVLADWGADVVKVEHPVSGDGQRGLMTSGLIPDTGGVNFMMEQSNRGKKSVGIDIATDDGRELIYRMAEKSDVFLTNFLPPARRKLGIDVEDIRARNPNIIYVRGHGQGARGPDSEKAGYDGTSFWSRGGIGQSITPAGHEYPIMQKAAFGDSIGAMTIAGGIAAALFKRATTGEASVVDVSLLGTAMWTLAPDIVASRLLKGDMPSFNHSDMPNPVVSNYRTKDGRWVMLTMLQSDRLWPDFCRHIGREDMIEDERFRDAMSRFQNRQECIRILDEVFAARTLAEWKENFKTMEGAWAPLQTAAELHEDEQALANGYFPEVEGGDEGQFRLVASPVQFDESPTELTRAPEHGEHTETVLMEMGIEWEEIERLKAAKAIL
jgi:crotonobetainyl-CoA:carnitine CoA-transferase CaiB-like acyl-CoA transferase